MEHKNITKLCLHCGGEFTPKHNNAKYCSEECRKAGSRAKQTAWKSEHADQSKRYQKRYYKKRRKKAEVMQQYKPNRLDEIAVEYDTNYGAYQREKTLAMIPKINTDLSRFKKRKEV